MLCRLYGVNIFRNPKDVGSGPLVSSYMFIFTLFLLFYDLKIFPTSLRSLGGLSQIVIEVSMNWILNYNLFWEVACLCFIYFDLIFIIIGNYDSWKTAKVWFHIIKYWLIVFSNRWRHSLWNHIWSMFCEIFWPSLLPYNHVEIKDRRFKHEYNQTYIFVGDSE